MTFFPLLSITTDNMPPAEREGYIMGIWFGVVVVALGIGKCIQIMRRPTTNTLCVCSLMLILLAWFLSSTASAMVLCMGVSVWIKTAVGILAISLVLASMITGIVGLALYNGGRFSQGRKQAVWGIALSSIMLLTTVWGFAVGSINKAKAESLVAESFDGKPIEKTEFNFSFAPTGKTWLVMKPQALNSSACLAFRHTRPEIYCTIIAEAAGLPEIITNEFVTNASKTKLESVCTVKQRSEEKRIINGQEFSHVTTSVRLDSNALNAQYEHWITTRNGYAYQIVFWGNPADSAGLSAEAQRMVAGFRILDPNKFAIGKGNMEDVRKPEWGYVTHLQDKGWSVWKDNSLRPALADFALTRGDAGLVVVPLRFDGEGPDLRAASRGLLSVLSFEYPKKGVYETRHLNYTRGDAVEITTERELDGKEYTYVLRIYKSKGLAQMAAAWQVKNQGGNLDALREALDGIEILPETTEAAPILVSNGARKQREEIINQIGLSYIERNEWVVSAKYFKEAFEIMRNNPVLLNNLAFALDHAGQQMEALDYIRPYVSRFEDNANFAAHFANLLVKSGDVDSGQKMFLSLIEKGLKDEDMLLDWLQLQMSRQPAALEAVEAYLKKMPASSKARLWHAQVLSSGGDFKRSVEVLEKLVADEPKNEDAIYELGETFNEAGDHDKAAAVAEKLIQDSHDNVRSRMILGWSQMGLKWYREAKATFEEAAKKEPDNKIIKRAIANASASLGQGDNSDIKKPIEPVRLPAALEKEIAEAVVVNDAFSKDASAVYLLRATGYYFKKGEPLRTTLHRRIKVLNTEGVNQFSTMEFPFDSIGEHIYVNRLEVKDADGKIIAKSSVDDAYILDRNENGTASYQKMLHVQVPSLKPGCTIEAEITREERSKADEFDFQRYYFSHSLPVACNALFIVGDVASVKAQLANTVDIKAFRSEHFASWVAVRPPQTTDESMKLPYDRIAPLICLSGAAKDWKQTGLDYLKKIEDRLEVDSAMNQMAENLVEGLSSQKEKIVALARYVQKELTYKAIEFGVRARRPNRASDTLKQRFGDCKDHALALHHLLKAAGIESYLVLVNTNVSLERSQPSLDQFNHMIVHVPSLGTNGWLDATNKDSDITILPPELLCERDALVLDAKEPHLVRLPPIPEGSAKVEIQRTITLEGQHDMRVEEIITLHGYYGAWMRGSFAADEPSERLRHMQRILGSHMPAQVEDFHFDTLDEPAQPAKLRTVYLVRNAVETTNEHYSTALPAAWENEYLTISFLRDRQTPFHFRMPFEINSEVILRLPAAPEDAAIAALTKKSTSEFCDWNIKSKVATGKKSLHEVTIYFHFRASPGEYPAKDYAKFQEDWEAGRRVWESRLAWSLQGLRR